MTSTKEALDRLTPLPRGMLSRPDILDQYEKKNIFIQPFDLESVGTNSYDIRLGGWIFREKFNSGLPTFHGQVEPRFLYNMYDRDHVKAIFEKARAILQGRMHQHGHAHPHPH